MHSISSRYSQSDNWQENRQKGDVRWGAAGGERTAAHDFVGVRVIAGQFVVERWVSVIHEADRRAVAEEGDGAIGAGRGLQIRW